jgi:PadR family transcriptional regulator AphA
VATDALALSLADWAVLGVVAAEPTHGWAVARQLAADGELGRVWTVPRPVVYRSLATLADHRLVEEAGAASGGRGPQRTMFRIARKGRTALHRWLTEPVEHVRDVRSAFLVKLALLDRAGEPLAPLVRRQLEQLEPLFAALNRRPRGEGFDVVLATWRRESALATRRFLQALATDPR